MRIRLLLLALIAIGVLSLPLRSDSQRRSVAFTFDDLPLADAGSAGMSPAEQIVEAHAVNAAILAALHRHHSPATGFVNENKVTAGGAIEQNRETLHLWIRDGQDLGNHTFSHADLNQLSADAFEKEILDGEPSIRSLMGEAGKSVRFLRYPFNHAGEIGRAHV